jgi:hypothetical protein
MAFQANSQVRGVVTTLWDVVPGDDAGHPAAEGGGARYPRPGVDRWGSSWTGRRWRPPWPIGLFPSVSRDRPGRAQLCPSPEKTTPRNRAKVVVGYRSACLGTMNWRPPRGSADLDRHDHDVSRLLAHCTYVVARSYPPIPTLRGTAATTGRPTPSPGRPASLPCERPKGSRRQETVSPSWTMTSAPHLEIPPSSTLNSHPQPLL